MHEKYGFKLRRGNSASTLSGCIQRNQSKMIFALPMDSKTVELLEKTLIGGFSCVDTRLAFDTNILISNIKSDLAKEFQDKKEKIEKLFTIYDCVTMINRTLLSGLKNS